MAPRAATEDIYMLGHLFSLTGVPTLVLPQTPRDRSPVVELFFNAYGKNPVREALLLALRKPPRPKGSAGLPWGIGA